jgi:coproporphyrinogen III oxidase-like Fe-S oxidoreductase
LEGVPALFRSLFAGPFEAFLGMPARHRRISMGVQTFDPDALRRMGRQGFGDRATVAKVV